VEEASVAAARVALDDQHLAIGVCPDAPVRYNRRTPTSRNADTAEIFIKFSAVCVVRVARIFAFYLYP
jgi:hypothetical protein